MNIIYPDLMHPKDVLQLRIQAKHEQIKAGPKGKDTILECDIETPAGPVRIHIPWMGIIDQGGNTIYPTDEQQRQQFEREMNERVAIRNSITNGAASLSPIPNDFGTTQTNKPITLKAPPPPNIDGAKPILSKEPPKLDGESSLPLPPLMP